MRLIVEPDGEMYEPADRTLLVGSAKHCDIRLASAADEHARVGREGVEAIADCRVGGIKLRSGERRQLAPDCVVEIGSARIVVEDPEHSIGALSTRSAAFHLGEIGPRAPSIAVVQGERVGKTLVLVEGTSVVVGRRGGDHRFLLHDDHVSRDHLEILWHAGSVVVRDLGSPRGSYLGRHRLLPHQRALWPSGKMLLIGRTVLGLDAPAMMRRQLANAIAREPEAPAPAPPQEEAACPEGAAQDHPVEPLAVASEQVVSLEGSAAPILAPAVERDVAPRAPRATPSRERIVMLIGLSALVLLALATVAWLASDLLTTSRGTFASGGRAS